MEKIILLGAGGHARSIIDSIEQSNIYEVEGFVISDKSEKMINDFPKYPILGTDKDLEYLFRSGIKNAFISIGYLGKGEIRNLLFHTLSEIGFHIPVIVDKTAILAGDISIGKGTFIGKGAIVNSNVRIGEMCIINTGAIVEHDCIVSDFSHISVGAVLCGGVSVGTKSFIGADTVIIQGCTIGEKCIVGAGTTIVKNVEDNTMIYDKIVKNRGGGVKNKAIYSFAIFDMPLLGGINYEY